jgi:hypothetical protein
MDDQDRKLVGVIEQPLWVVINVPTQVGDTGVSHAYTTGLFRNWGHPEIVVYGLENEMMRTVLNLIGEQVASGARRFQPHIAYDNVLDGLDVMFLPVARPETKGDFGWAIHYYQRLRSPPVAFPALQCVWPTMSGVWPWQPEWPARLAGRQPLIGSPPG